MEREWIREQINKAGITQVHLAEAIGMHPTAVNKLLTGNRRLKADEADKISAFFNQTPPPRKVKLLPPVPDWPAPETMSLDVAVRGTAAASPSGAFQIDTDGAPVDYVRRPPAITAAANVYAIYVVGESMSPRYEPGSLVFVHPDRPSRPGDFVIVQTRNYTEDQIQSYIKKLIKRTDSELILGQLNPPTTIINIKLSVVVAIHKVLNTNDLFGS